MDEALLNDLVLRTLFNFLGAKDLRSSRLVCSKWEEMSRQYFLKRSKVFIKTNLCKGSESLDNFKELFEDASFMPFTKFYFAGTFPAKKFETIFQFWPSINELFFDSLDLEDNDDVTMPNYNVRSFGSLNLKTLSCVGNYDRTKLVIPLSQIGSIKNFYLDGPFVLDFDAQISPDELSIQGGVTFLRKGKLIQNEIRLNDFINLETVRKLIINQRPQTNVIVDVADCYYLNILSIHSGQLIGLSPHSKIKELSISTSCDLSFLPMQIEKLHLGRYHVSCTSVVNFPNLKYLHTHCGPYLSKFVECPNLTDLVIGEYYSHYQQVPIPANVSRMFVNVHHFQFPSNEITQLEYLHLELDLWTANGNQASRNFNKPSKILKNVQTQTLVITFKLTVQRSVVLREMKLKTNYQFLIDDLIKIVKLQAENGGTVAFGGIEWDSDCASLLAIVDEKRPFYVFQNGRGKGILEEEFKKLITLK